MLLEFTENQFKYLDRISNLYSPIGYNWDVEKVIPYLGRYSYDARIRDNHTVYLIWIPMNLIKQLATLSV